MRILTSDLHKLPYGSVEQGVRVRLEEGDLSLIDIIDEYQQSKQSIGINPSYVSLADCNEYLGKQDSSYSFHTTAPEVQIDFVTISEDLSPSRPLAFVEAAGEKEWLGYVVVHRSLIDKMRLEEDALRSLYEDALRSLYDDTFLPSYANVIKCTAPKDFSKWKVYFSEVKQSTWPPELRNPAKVVVSHPEV